MPLDINVAKMGGIPPTKLTVKSNAPVWLDRAADELTTSSVPGSLVNVARRTFQLTNLATSQDANRQMAVTQLETFGSIIGFLGIISSIRTLVTESKKTFSNYSKEAAYVKKVRNLTMASNVFGVIVGSLNIVTLLNKFGAISLGAIAKSMGNFPVVAGGFALFPLGSLVSLLVIVRTSLDIAASALKIKHIHTSISRAQLKIRSWSHSLTTESIENRITRIKALKMKNLEEEAKELTIEAKQLIIKVKKIECDQKQLNEKLNSNKISKFLKTYKIKNLENKKLKLVKTQQAKCEEIENIKVAYEKLEKKVTQWGKIKYAIEGGALTKKGQNQIEQLSAKKIEKWNVKKENLKLEKKKTGLTIAHRTALIISLIAVLVINAIGIALIPVLITTTSIALCVALSGLGLLLYRKYKTGKPVPVVDMKLSN